jgi:hypothetical protein
VNRHVIFFGPSSILQNRALTVHRCLCIFKLFSINHLQTYYELSIIQWSISLPNWHSMTPDLYTSSSINGITSSWLKALILFVPLPPPSVIAALTMQPLTTGMVFLLAIEGTPINLRGPWDLLLKDPPCFKTLTDLVRYFRTSLQSYSQELITVVKPTSKDPPSMTLPPIGLLPRISVVHYAMVRNLVACVYSNPPGAIFRVSLHRTLNISHCQWVHLSRWSYCSAHYAKNPFG